MDLIKIRSKYESERIKKCKIIFKGQVHCREMSTIKFLKESILAYHTVPKSLVSSVAGWCTTYFVVKRFTGQEPEWAVRVVTALHAIIITILAVIDWSYIREWNIERLGDTNSAYEEIILCLTLGYFLFDIVWIIKYQTEGTAMYCHHAVSILCLILIIAKGTSATEALVGISGLELTNPCLQARWFLRTYGYQGTWIHTIVEVIFMTTFIVLRIFYGTYLTYNVIVHPKCHLAFKVGNLGLYVVSWVFACQMFLYVNKRYKKSLKSKE